MTYTDQKPSTCSEMGCPLAIKGKGFCLGQGDPTKAKYYFQFEAPGHQEVSFRLAAVSNRAFMSTQEEVDKELAVRRRDYPNIDEKFLRVAAPIVGMTGAAFQFWLAPPAGIRREECFFDNTIRCLPPAAKSGASYPTGEDKKAAEKCCRAYDRVDKFRPTVAVLSLHPATILRDIVPSKLVVEDLKKVRDFTAQGLKVMALMGGKASHAFLRYASNSTRWRGHYELLSPDWPDTYKARFEYKAKRKKVEIVKPLELTVEPCKSYKRYKAKRAPKCTCKPCWEKFESYQIENVKE